MATYLYVIKKTLRHNESDKGSITKLEALTVFDYVAAVRRGPGYGTEPSDPRGNLIPLPRYLKEVQPGPVDTLGLRTASGTPCALLIFGALGGGKIYRELTGNDTWSKINEIRAGTDPVKCMVMDSKFGTGHDKMLMMVASNKFDFPKGMKEAPVTNGTLYARHITMYFQSFG
jgi:hypothetical protein